MKIRTKFSWPKIRLRTKRMMRKKYGITIKLTDLDRVWDDYVTYGIIKPLLKYGKVVVDERFSLEIVGRNIVDCPKVFVASANGFNIRSGGKKGKVMKINHNRPGLVYSIEFKNERYKGKVIFIAADNLKKVVSNQLFNSNQYYRLAV